MSQTILSIDVGIKNLGYCLIKKTGDNFIIEKWGILNLTDLDKNCKHDLNILCKEKGKYYKKSDKSFCICDKHKSLYEDIKKISQVNLKQSLDITSGILFKLLDNEKDFLNVDTVLIENQPALKNPSMKSIAMLVYSYFVIKGINNNDNKLKEVKFICPSNKLKVNKIESDILLLNEKNKKDIGIYKLTKKLGIKYCSALINSDDLIKLNEHKKKDDLCDAFLQGFYYLFNPIPKLYFDKLKTVL
jgi:hypothetical protein